MKKGVMTNSRIIFVSSALILAVVLVVSLVLAASFSSVVTPTTANQSISTSYNFTINNNDTTTNITQVNITIPSGFTFNASTNGTTATGNFSNTATILEWNDSVLLIENGTIQYFWFNATSATPGAYNFNVSTLDSSGVLNWTNVSVTINDTITPTVNLSSPTNNTYSNNLSQTFTANESDNYKLFNATLYIWDSINALINTSSTNISGTTNQTSWDYTFSSDGNYTWNVNTCDSAGNCAFNSTNYTLVIDTTNPVVTLISPADSHSSTTRAYNFTFNVTDANSVPNCSLILDGTVINILTNVNHSGLTSGMYNSSLSIKTHTWSVNCTDFVGNVGNSSERTLIIKAPAQSSSSFGSGFGFPNYMPNAEELNNGYQKLMYKNCRVSFSVRDESHTFKVEDVTGTSVKISLSSTPQEAILSVGQEKKFDLSGDGYYEVLVRLNSIDADNKIYPKANFTIQTIHEEINQQQEGGIVENTTTTAPVKPWTKPGEVKEESSLMWLWVLITLIIILILFGTGYRKFVLKN